MLAEGNFSSGEDVLMPNQRCYDGRCEQYGDYASSSLVA